jgi:hypothetical protein
MIERRTEAERVRRALFDLRDDAATDVLAAFNRLDHDLAAADERWHSAAKNAMTRLADSGLSVAMIAEWCADPRITPVVIKRLLKTNAQPQ